MGLGIYIYLKFISIPKILEYVKMYFETKTMRRLILICITSYFKNLGLNGYFFYRYWLHLHFKSTLKI